MDNKNTELMETVFNGEIVEVTRKTRKSDETKLVKSTADALAKTNGYTLGDGNTIHAYLYPQIKQNYRFIMNGASVEQIVGLWTSQAVIRSQAKARKNADDETGSMAELVEISVKDAFKSRIPKNDSDRAMDSASKLSTAELAVHIAKLQKLAG